MIDFSKVSQAVKDLFENHMDNLDYLFTYLSGYFNIKLYERETLFIFDEVQFCIKVGGAIKHLVADGRYDCIETGSLVSIDVNARYREYYGAFYWLQDAGLINLAYNTTEPNIGLKLNMDSSSFKCYMFDKGLLLSMAFDEKGLVDEEVYKKYYLIS